MRYCIAVAVLAFLASVLVSAPVSVLAAGDAANLVLNPGAEQGKGDQPSVWFAATVPAEGLKMWRATDVSHSGAASLAISNSHDYPETVCNNWAQNVQEIPAGQAVRLDAWLKTDDADAANVCVQCWDIDGKNMLAFGTTPVFRGTEDWVAAHSDPVIVPEDTASIIVRASLAGKGKAWFDDLTLAVVAAKPGRKGAAAPSAPAMADGQGVASHAVPEDLAKAAGGKVIKAVPVTKDCMILAYIPFWAHGDADNVGVADNDGGVRALFAWTAIPPLDAKNEKLKFILAVYSRGTTVGENPGKIGTYEILKLWDENSSWKTQPKVANEPTATYDFQAENDWKLFDVTPLVRTQAKEGRKAYGVELRFVDESKAGQEHNWSGYAFVSREATGEFAEYKPVLLVVEPPKSGASVESTSRR